MKEKNENFRKTLFKFLEGEGRGERGERETRGTDGWMVSG
jgi:hypothetical protein